MRGVSLSSLTTWAKFAAISLLAVLVGIGISIASSPASLRDHRLLGTPVEIGATPTPTPFESPSPPTVTSPGVLGAKPRIEASGSTSVTALAQDVSAATADGGKTWTVLSLPSGAASVASEFTDPTHGVAGGNSIRFTTDGGVTWKPALGTPPGRGPFQIVEVSPFDGNVWFFVHGGKLLRTRDASATWRDLAGLPNLGAPLMAAGTVFGQFYLASGSAVFELIDNGEQIVPQPSLPSGVAAVQLAVGGGATTLLARGSDGTLYGLTNGRWSSVAGGLAGPMAASINTIVTGDGASKLGVQGVVMYSTDGGATWLAGAGLPYDQSVESLAGQPGSSVVFAYCYGGDVYVSTDGGRDWAVFSRGLRTRAG